MTAVLATVSSIDIAIFSFVILLTVLIFFSFFLYGVWLDRLPNSKSPYSRQPLSFGYDLSYQASENTLRYLYNLYQYDNRIFDLKRAAVCRETGRIFPNAITWYGKIQVDWTFLNKRHPGHYVSWGSLSDEQQLSVLNSHESLEGFQTEFSSPAPNPKSIEAKYAHAYPGPLYVDINTYTLLGWKLVPGTDLEVLIVQKPTHIMTLSFKGD